MTEDQMAAYVAGFIDGEGHIGCHFMARGFWTRSISFVNTESVLIDQMVFFLEKLGFPTRETVSKGGRPGWNDKRIVYIAGGRNEFIRFQRLIPIQSEAKKENLERLLASYFSPEEIRGRRLRGTESDCEICSATVYATPSLRRRGGGRFCSNKCRYLSRRNRVQLLCKTCGAPFFVNKAREESAGFCSLKCFGASQAPRIRHFAKAGAAARWARS